MAEDSTFLNLRGLTTFKNNLDKTYMKADSLVVDNMGSSGVYRLIKQYKLTPNYNNFRDVFAISTRHSGVGILLVACGNNSTTASAANTYGRIEYYGMTDSVGLGGVFNLAENSFLLYRTADFKTLSLFYKNTDYNSMKMVRLAGTPGTSMDGELLQGQAFTTTIDSSKYGTLLSTTQFGISDSYINSLFTS